MISDSFAGYGMFLRKLGSGLSAGATLSEAACLDLFGECVEEKEQSYTHVRINSLVYLEKDNLLIYSSCYGLIKDANTENVDELVL